MKAEKDSTATGFNGVPGDRRKFCEQQGDILQWDQSNKNYILTHGMSGADWRFYKHPLAEPVYDLYMRTGEMNAFEIRSVRGIGSA